MTTTQTHDLGEGWYVNLTSNATGTETASFRNPDKGQQIDLPADSMETLRRLLNKSYRVS